MTFSFLEVLSELFGWVYTICWSLSFYPQPLLNFRRKSTTGTTIDFPAINVLGFVGYFVSNAAFLYSPRIREEYALRNHGLTPTVQFNDFAFAAHAIVLSAICLSQFVPSVWGFEKRGGPGSKPSRFIIGVFVSSILGVLGVAFIVVAKNDPDPGTGWAWIDVIYACSYVKVFITLVKYMPQVLTNYRNRSTQGWSIGQILLDIVGGVLSILQLGIDSYLQGDWSGVTGNPVKLLLGNISIVFDVIFITQHYCLYPGYKSKGISEEYDPLLSDSDRERMID